ncbi:hypothetical protein GEMRC1_001951 [Eukaryota sp. GEM-RC1]
MSSKSLFVGDLSLRTNEEHLKTVFGEIGTVASVKIPKNRITGDSLGYAYINFEDAEDAAKAKDNCNYVKINEKPCRVMFAESNPTRRINNLGNLFVKGLHANIDPRRLEDLFSPFGNIISCKLKTNDQGKSLGYAYIQYDTSQSALKAMEEMNGKELGSREEPSETLKVSVQQFQKAEQRCKMIDGIRAQTNVFVKNLPIEVTEEKFLEIMSSFGEVKSHRLTVVESKNKKVGFADFTTIEQAIKAVKDLNQTLVFGGDPIETNFFQPKQVRTALLKKEYIRRCTELKEASKHKNLWVGSLPPNFTSESLKEAFSPFGTITSAVVMKAVTGVSRQFGFVCYEKPEEAKAALGDMNRRLLPDSTQQLRVCMFRTKHEREQYQLQKNLYENRTQYQHNNMRRGYNNSHRPKNTYLPGNLPAGQSIYAAGARNVPDNSAKVTVPSFDTVPAAVSVPAAVPVVDHTEPEDEKEAFIKMLNNLEDEEEKRQELGERLYPLIEPHAPDLAAKITGLFLAMDDLEEIITIYRDEAALHENIKEAQMALNEPVEEH